MPKKKQRGLYKPIKVGEDVRMAIQIKLNQFRDSEEEKEYEFPSSLTSEERCYIHRLALELGLKTKSRGKGASRYLTVYKREGSTIMQSDAMLEFSSNSRQIALNLLSQFPVTNKERQDLLPPLDRERNLYVNSEARDMSRAMGKLNSGIPQIPPCSGFLKQSDSVIASSREKLPIWPQRSEIIQAISQNQVTLVTGETGSGKTTQVPQFILESCSDQRQACRIVCTEPRRLAAVTVAERVAFEREEKVGQTVGFQIRLESRVSPKTLLTFCTNGVLLRTLMGGDAALGTITHIIIDEVHERDRFCDFLLTVLREALAKFRNLKIILMSATIDVQLFLNYFSGIKQVVVPGKMFPVKELYLEDVLIGLNYSNSEMKRLESSSGCDNLENIRKRCEKFLELTKGIQDLKVSEEKKDPKQEPLEMLNSSSPENATQSDEDVVLEGGEQASEDEVQESKETELSEETKQKLDEILAECFIHGRQEDFDQLMRMVQDQYHLIDYKHSITGVTPLIAASCRGQISVMEQLLEHGADVDVKASNNWSARDFAMQQDLSAAVQILETFKQTLAPISSECYDSVVENLDAKDMTEEQRNILNLYHFAVSDDKIDYDLCTTVIKHIQDSVEDEGAVLVFLSGYDDIVQMKERLQNVPHLLVLTLHSQMGSIEQKKVFKPPPFGVRKVILSTNIAETSLTIDDVVYVIDTGKVKEKCFDSLTNTSMLKLVWSSKTSAAQRKGRAGRCKPGLVYRLYSRVRFANFATFSTPEILRTPLMELCLHSKSLTPPNTVIADFLSKAPQSPSVLVTRNAISLLKTIEALDAWEDVTELGNHLLDLPIEPKLGKMVLYAVVLKCLDPILTIVCCTAYRDPFLLPINPELKKRVLLSKQKFSGGSFSDHMTLLRVFQGWQKARADGNEKSFCQKHQISTSTMEMITGMRTQLLGQLRASGFVRAKGVGDIRDLNKNSENWAVVKAALTAGCYPNLARFDRQAKQLRSMRESKVRIHPSSTILIANANQPNVVSSKRNSDSMSKLPTDWLIFDEMTRAGHLAMIKGVTAVSPFTVMVFAGPNRLPIEAVSEADAGVQGNKYLEELSDSEVEEKIEGENTVLRIDEWTVFRSDAELAHLALQLRQKWSSLLLRRLHSPGKPSSQVDNNVVDSLVNILSAEEQHLGLRQPQGIGQRPKPIGTDSMCSTSGISSSLMMANIPQVSPSNSSSSFQTNSSPTSGPASRRGSQNSSTGNYGSVRGGNGNSSNNGRGISLYSRNQYR